MPRALFVLLLSAFASVALADAAAVSDDSDPKSAKTTAVAAVPGGDADSLSRGGHGRGRGNVRSTSRRWHSLLPGMFR